MTYIDELQNNQDYPITYTASFVIFWGIALCYELYIGGLLAFAFTCMAIMIVISHEHAHAEETLKRGAKVKGITFTWLGGAVEAEIEYAADAVEMLLAGVKDTGYYAFSFIGLFLILTYFGRDLVNGYMFILFPYKDLVAAIAFFATTLFIMNILPLSWYIKEHKCYAMTDGWAAYRYMELRDELWNDGKIVASSINV